MQFRRAKLLLILAYVLTMTALISALFAVRSSTLATLDTPEAREHWREWKAEIERQKKSGGPVERRPVRSDEPPALILLRDRFPVILAMSVLIGSFLFAFLAFVTWGATRAGSK
jgi:hypothetical protein